MRILSIDPAPRGAEPAHRSPSEGARFLRQTLATIGMNVDAAETADCYDTACDHGLVMFGIADEPVLGPEGVANSGFMRDPVAGLTPAAPLRLSIARQSGPPSARPASNDWVRYGWACELAVELAALMSSKSAPTGLFLNINVPDRLLDMKPALTVLGLGELDRLRHSGRELPARHVWRSNGRLGLDYAQPRVDADAISDGRVSVSPLRWSADGWHIDAEVHRWTIRAMHELLPRLLGEPQDCACCARPANRHPDQREIDSLILPINSNHPTYQRSNT